MWLVGDSWESRGTFYTCPGEPVRPCSFLSLAWFPVMKIWWDTTNSPSMNANMCFLCISLILLVLLVTYQSLATALWICWHCNGGKIKFPVNNRLLDSQQAFDFHLKYLHGPKKLRIRMNEDYPSTCPHNSGSFAFMLNIVCLVEATEVRGVVPSTDDMVFNQNLCCCR